MAGYRGTNAIDALLLRRNLGNFINSNAKKREFAGYLNNLDYVNELQHILMLFCSRFKWDLTPLNVSNTYIENGLFYNSFMAFYNSPEYGWIVLPANPIGFNVYNEPTRIRLMGFNYEKEIDYSIDSKEIVLFSDNRARECCLSYFMRNVSQMADLGRSCEVYANAMKSPLVIPTSFDKKKTAETYVLNISTNDPYVLIDSKAFPIDTMGEQTFQSFTMTHSADGLKGLLMYKKTIYEDMLTRMGIDVTAVRKEAQVTDDEANKNDLLCRIMLQSAYDCRKEAVDKMIELSGLNISCNKIDALEERDESALYDDDDIDIDEKDTGE